MADQKPENCSKCGQVLDTTGTPKWCKSCRADYQRERTNGIEERAEKRGLERGITAEKQSVEAYFRYLGNAHFSGTEVAAMVAKMPGPRVED